LSQPESLPEASATLEVYLTPENNDRLANLCGQFDEHLRQIESRLNVDIHNRGNRFRVIADPADAHTAIEVLKTLYSATEHEQVSPERVHLELQDADIQARKDDDAGESPATPSDAISVRKGRVEARGPHQVTYLRSIRDHDLTFGIGPAGTGKTYLAVAAAVAALERDEVRRLVLVRPAVEAGERLGFLPGDMAQKVDPYLRPIFDALYELMGVERTNKLIERHIIEVAPLAYMRGRTLNHAFVIMDEAQNTTVEQMKMFLTRLGFGSTAVVTGDITQTDLGPKQPSGLRHVRGVLQDVEGVAFVPFDSRDVVRHPLVQRIVDAYEAAETDGADGGAS
jgi:phosphate starvation-inducible PhoH-like protein